MLYTELTIKNRTYKLRLATRNIVALEKSIGCNPLNIFGNGEQMPEVTVMVQILFHSLQKYEHGIGLDEAFSLFDDYLEEHSMAEFIGVIMDIYRASGIIKDSNSEEDEKNAVKAEA